MCVWIYLAVRCGTRKKSIDPLFTLLGRSHNLEPGTFPHFVRRLRVAEMAENVDYLTADLRDFHVRDLPSLGNPIVWLLLARGIFSFSPYYPL